MAIIILATTETLPCRWSAVLVVGSTGGLHDVWGPVSASPLGPVSWPPWENRRIQRMGYPKQNLPGALRFEGCRQALVRPICFGCSCLLGEGQLVIVLRALPVEPLKLSGTAEAVLLFPEPASGVGEPPRFYVGFSQATLYRIFNFMSGNPEFWSPTIGPAARGAGPALADG